MAEMLTDAQMNRQMDGDSQPTMQEETQPETASRYMRGHLSRPFDDFDVHQKIQIEKETMSFLKKCRRFKRPPQSIRIKGANVVQELDKLKYFSQFETILLNHQIAAKDIKIKELIELSKDEPLSRLPAVDRKKLYKHFRKKLNFYKLQDTTRWATWPEKEVIQSQTQKQKMKKKDRNFKKRQKRRSRKTRYLANKAIESGSVVVLVEEDVPPGAIAVLGKGFGYVPTPEPDPLEERLQMRQTTNRILTASMIHTSEQPLVPVPEEEKIPTKLLQPSYNLKQPASDRHVNTLIERLVTEHDATLLSRKRMKGNMKSNLSKDERDGLKWLKEMTSKEKISVVQADKGGAVLIVPPELLRKKVVEKLENTDVYTKLDGDPLCGLKKELFELWKLGKNQNLVSAKIAHEIGGVSENDNMSTSPKFKPGVPYFYPMLKIHKLRKEDLVPGLNPLPVW